MASFERISQSVLLAQDLFRLFTEDQNDRASGLMESDPQLFKYNDGLRYKRAEEIYLIYKSTPAVFSGEMKYNLALLFQHGLNSDDYARALELARSSEQDGFEGAESLAKAAEDRYLISIGKTQKWGTQVFRDQE